MDDKTFDLKTANDWIKVIENQNDPREKDLYPLVNLWLSETKTESLIDVGCGQGKLTKKIGNYIKYYGIDPSPHLIKRAKSLYSSRTFSLGNAYKIPN